MIKIKLAMLDNDAVYVEKLMAAFSIKYPDELEVYSFTDKGSAIQSLKDSRIDVFVSAGDIEIDIEEIPARCAFAYFTESNNIDTLNGQRTVCKYQKVDLIYKEILSIFFEKSAISIDLKNSGNNTLLNTFTSCAGGVGSSSLAAACAVYFSRMGEKVLYLNFEMAGTSASFFSGEGMSDMGDIIYALKSKKSNLALKLESAVRQDQSGVYFYESCKLVLDVLEMTKEDMERLIREFLISGTYQRIILDTDFKMDDLTISLMNQSNSVVLVSDGSEISNTKTRRVLESLDIIERLNDWRLISRLHICYNKFSSKTGKEMHDLNIKLLGGVPRYEGAATDQIIERLAAMELFKGMDEEYKCGV